MRWRSQQRLMARLCRRLIVDADIVGSASETRHPISSSCRKFLLAILEARHCVVITDEIHSEWNRHLSKYSRRWLTSIHARRLFWRSKGAPDKHLRARILATAPATERDSVAKDVHLVEAAIDTDFVVTSQDEEARSAFSRASVDVRELRSVMWVNPTIREERPVCWLLSGAVAERHRQLGTFGQ